MPETDIKALLKICRSGTAEQLSAHLPVAQTIRTRADETPLHLVITHNPAPTPLAKLLLAHGHDANARGYCTENKTALHLCARRGCAETTRLLLTYGARVDTVKRGDWTPLMIAAAHGSVEVVAILLDAGANVDAVNRLGECCVHLSARSSVDCLRLCINSGGSVARRTRNGRSALHYAARAGAADCMKLLLNAGCDGGWADHAGMTAAHEASVGGFVECLELVKEFAWAVDAAGGNCLHAAAVHGNEKIVEALLGWGRERVDDVDGRGFTALKLALYHGHTGVVERLLDAGAGWQRGWIEECRVRDDCIELLSEHKRNIAANEQMV